MNASVNYKGNSTSGNLGITGSNHNDETNTFKSNNTYVSIKTYGGVRDGGEAVVNVKAIKDLNVDLTSWMHQIIQ